MLSSIYQYYQQFISTEWTTSSETGTRQQLQRPTLNEKFENKENQVVMSLTSQIWSQTFNALFSDSPDKEIAHTLPSLRLVSKLFNQAVIENICNFSRIKFDNYFASLETARLDIFIKKGLPNFLFLPGCNFSLNTLLRIVKHLPKEWPASEIGTRQQLQRLALKKFENPVVMTTSQIWSQIFKALFSDSLDKEIAHTLPSLRLVSKLFNKVAIENICHVSKKFDNYFASLETARLDIFIKKGLPNFLSLPGCNFSLNTLIPIDEKLPKEWPAIDRAQFSSTICKANWGRKGISEKYQLQTIELYTEAAIAGDEGAAEWLINKLTENTHCQQLVHLGLAKAYLNNKKIDEGKLHLQTAYDLWFGDLKNGKPTIAMRELCVSKNHSVFLTVLGIDINTTMNDYLDSVINEVEMESQGKVAASQWLLSMFLDFYGLAPEFDVQKKSKALGLIIKSWEFKDARELGTANDNYNQIRPLITSIINKSLDDTTKLKFTSKLKSSSLDHDRLVIDLNKDMLDKNNYLYKFFKNNFTLANYAHFEFALVITRKDWEDFKEFILKNIETSENPITSPSHANLVVSI